MTEYYVTAFGGKSSTYRVLPYTETMLVDY